MQNTCTYLGPEYDPRTWDYASKPTPYCGCQALAGKSYCQEHYPVVYASGTALRKRHKDLRKKQSIEDTVQMIIDIAEELEIEGWTPEQGWEEDLALR
jgi:hypothetical protein